MERIPFYLQVSPSSNKPIPIKNKLILKAINPKRFFTKITHFYTKAYWAHFRKEKNYIFRELTRNFREFKRNFRE